MVFMMPTIVRAQVAHTPRNPFVSEDALETFPDGALAFEDGRIVAVGVFDSVIGALGLELMEWLRSVALPEEARLEDSGYAASVADQCPLGRDAGTCGNGDDGRPRSGFVTGAS